MEYPKGLARGGPLLNVQGTAQMSFAQLIDALAKLDPQTVLKILTFIQQIAQSIGGLFPTPAAANALPVKLALPHDNAVSIDKKNQADRLAAVIPNSGFDGHRIAGLISFLEAHPQLVTWIMGMFGIKPPVAPTPAA